MAMAVLAAAGLVRGPAYADAWVDNPSSTGGGGSGSPGGSNQQVQFNDGGNFGGDAGLTYDKTTDALTVVDITATDDVSAGGVMFVSGLLTAGTIASGDVAVTGDVTVSDDLSAGGALFVSGTLTAAAISNMDVITDGSNYIKFESAQDTKLDFLSAGGMTPNTMTADYTLKDGDEGQAWIFDCAANCTVTVPGATFAAGESLTILKFNSASSLTFASSEIMLYTADSLVFASNYTAATVYFYSAGGAFIIGGMASP